MRNYKKICATNTDELRLAAKNEGRNDGSFYSKISMNSYGCISCINIPELIVDALIQTITGIVIMPLLHIGIASFWVSKRTKKTRKNIFFGWFIFVIIGSTLQLMGIIA